MKSSIDDGTVDLAIELENSWRARGVRSCSSLLPRCLCILGPAGEGAEGFQRVTLRPKERAVVSFSIPVDMLNFTDAAYQRVVEAGEFEVLSALPAVTSDRRAGLKSLVKTVCSTVIGAWRASQESSRRRLEFRR